jgi:O-antigen/teichoic acid export membrane protein
MVKTRKKLESQKELDFLTIKKRAVSGAVILSLGGFSIQFFNFLGFSLLAAFLEPATYGVFFIVSALVDFFAYFSDIGLAAALIQKKEPLTQKDLRSTFCVQQALVISLALLIFLVAPLATSWYKLTLQGLWLLRVLAVSLFLSSLKTIPSVLLERGLKFNRFIIPQIIEAVVFNGIAVFLAWRGWGIVSFSWAVILRGLMGLFVIYILAPWRIGLDLDKKALKGLLKFGLPYQVKTLIAVVKDNLMTAFLGGIIGSLGIGFIGWAQKWAFLPLRLVMDNAMKVTFPAYSRLQEHSQKLSVAIEKTLFFVTLLVFPMLTGLAVLAPFLIQVIPRYGKWQPALGPLWLYCINAAWAAVTTPLVSFLEAIGQIKKSLKLMIMWLVLTWLTMPFLAVKMGFLGVALASALIPFSSIVAILMVKREISFQFLPNVLVPLLGSVIMGGGLYLALLSCPIKLTSVLLLIPLGTVLYLATILILEKYRLINAIKDLYSAFH